MEAQGSSTAVALQVLQFFGIQLTERTIGPDTIYEGVWGRYMLQFFVDPLHERTLGIQLRTVTRKDRGGVILRSCKGVAFEVKDGIRTVCVSAECGRVYLNKWGMHAEIF